MCINDENTLGFTLELYCRYMEAARVCRILPWTKHETIILTNHEGLWHPNAPIINKARPRNRCQARENACEWVSHSLDVTVGAKCRRQFSYGDFFGRYHLIIILVSVRNNFESYSVLLLGDAFPSNMQAGRVWKCNKSVGKGKAQEPRSGKPIKFAFLENFKHLLHLKSDVCFSSLESQLVGMRKENYFFDILEFILRSVWQP